MTFIPGKKPARAHTPKVARAQQQAISEKRQGPITLPRISIQGAGDTEGPAPNAPGRDAIGILLGELNCVLMWRHTRPSPEQRREIIGLAADYLAGLVQKPDAVMTLLNQSGLSRHMRRFELEAVAYLACAFPKPGGYAALAEELGIDQSEIDGCGLKILVSPGMRRGTRPASIVVARRKAEALEKKSVAPSISGLDTKSASPCPDDNGD